LRTGFTLLELAAALALTGMVLAGAWRLVSQLGDERDRFGHARARAYASANGVRVLRDVVAQAEVDPDSSGQFDGSENAATFDSWCAAPGGYAERCRVTVSVVNSGDSSLVILSGGAGTAVKAWVRPKAQSEAAQLLYGDNVDGVLAWRASWGRTIRAPVALAIARGADTIILPIGAP
jgi:prepilin-type N-terminal cleavage/methylation domain-containing protein